jgi:C-terminal processing protease CtpA/Prc
MRDLAAVYARQGKTTPALDALEVMQAQGWIPRVADELRGTDFASLRDEPRFKAILATLDLTQKLWADDAFATPYRESLDEAERVAGLSLFWSEARHAFVHFDRVPELDWNRAYRDFLPQVVTAKNTRDYYAVLMRFAALLHDGHTNVYPPEALEDRFYARPPLRTALVEDKVLITALGSPTLARLGLGVGDEVVAIDGEAVRDYAEHRIAPTVSSSTPQDRDVRMYGYELLMGDADAPVHLSVCDARGRAREITVPRKGYDDVIAPKAFEFRKLPGGIVALTLDHFESDAGVKAFEAAWPSIRRSKGLILDVRGNGGGSSNVGYDILSRLSHAPVPTSRQSAAWIDPVRRARAGIMVEWRPQPGSGNPYRREHAEVYDGPVAVLIGPRTFSAAEDFVVSFDAMKRGILVGETTAGSTGQPLFFKLPGGGSARICVKRDSYPDGREFVGKGIAPAIEVKTTITDVRMSRDAVLERARRELLQPATR